MMTDHAIDKIWESLNEGGDLEEKIKPTFISDCKEFGMLVAIFNLGWMSATFDTGS